MDLSKAFDTLAHPSLLSKLQHYGIRGIPYEWFNSYLTNRKQHTVYNSHCSENRQLYFGVPQGSILGPLLFLIYINDIVKCTPFFHYVIFADDTTLVASYSDIPLLINAMNVHLQSMHSWGGG